MITINFLSFHKCPYPYQKTYQLIPRTSKNMTLRHFNINIAEPKPEAFFDTTITTNIACHTMQIEWVLG